MHASMVIANECSELNKVKKSKINRIVTLFPDRGDRYFSASLYE